MSNKTKTEIALLLDQVDYTVLDQVLNILLQEKIKQEESAAIVGEISQTLNFLLNLLYPNKNYKIDINYKYSRTFEIKVLHGIKETWVTAVDGVMFLLDKDTLKFDYLRYLKYFIETIDNGN